MYICRDTYSAFGRHVFCYVSMDSRKLLEWRCQDLFPGSFPDHRRIFENLDSRHPQVNVLGFELPQNSEIFFDYYNGTFHSFRSHSFITNPINIHYSQALNGLAPSYLSELISLHSPTRTLRASTESLLSVPTCNQAFGDRAFSVCAPQLWNKLPQAIKASDNVDIFKKRLKAHLFIEAFG